MIILYFITRCMIFLMHTNNITNQYKSQLKGIKLVTHVVSALESFFHVLVHVVVVERHEEGVDYDTEGDEELHEWIEHNERHVLLQLQPEPTTVPHAEHVDPFGQGLQGPFLERWPIFVVLCRREVVYGHCQFPAISIGSSFHTLHCYESKGIRYKGKEISLMLMKAR